MVDQDWNNLTDEQKFSFLHRSQAMARQAIQGLAAQLEDLRGRLSKAEAAIGEPKK